MKLKTRDHIEFDRLPRDYAALCRFHLPRPVRDKTEYEETLEIAEAFAGFETRMTSDQEDYFDLLTSLLEAWENEHVEWKGKTPVEILNHLLQERGISRTGLSGILGVSPKLGPMILRGDRALTAEHARKLGDYFGLPPGVFIGDSTHS